MIRYIKQRALTILKIEVDLIYFVDSVDSDTKSYGPLTIMDIIFLTKASQN